MKIILKYILLLVFISLNVFALELLEDEKRFIKTNNEVKVALMPDFSPFSFIENDKVVGFEHDLLELLSKKTDLKFVKEYGIWNKNFQKFKSANVDMIASISYKKEREPFTSYTKPYYEIPIMIFIRDDFGQYNGLNSLKGKKVGILKDVFYTKEIEQISDIKIIKFETYDEITKSLVYGKIDALVQNLPNINHLIKKNLYTNLLLADELKLLGINKEDLRFGINPSKPILKTIIQKGLDSITKQEWEQLINKWIDVNINNTKYLIERNKKEQEYIQNKNQITMCIDPNWMPLESFDKNGKHIGMTADYYKLFQEVLNTKFKVIHTNSWEQSLNYAKMRKCDILSLAMQSPKRSEYLKFTTPYLSIPLVIATKIEVPFINDINELKGLNVGIPKGYAFSEFIKKQYPNINIINVKNIDEGLKKVRDGKLDAYIGTLTSIGYKIQKEYLGELKITGKLEKNWELGIGVRDDDPLLLSVLQKAINSITKEQHSNILNKWVSVKYDKGIDYTLLIYIILGALIIVSFFIYWNHKIRKAYSIIEKQNKQLEKLAATDKLTGVFNRMKLDDILQAEIDRSQRYKHSLGCAIIDVDHFKSTNDTYGHLIGDQVLKEITKIVSKNIRKSDYFGRWGGEEFLLVLPEIDNKNLANLLDKIRHTISEYKFKDIGEKTISIGATVYQKEDTLDSITKRADEALYEAKNGGRNKVCIKI